MKLSILTFVTLVLLAAGNLSSQSLSLTDEYGSAIAPDSYYYIWGDSGMYTVIYSHIAVTNNGASALDVKVKKAEVSVVSGSENAFCWGQCFLPTTFVSPSPINIGAGVTDASSFIGDYKPKGNIGQTTIRYTFFDMNNVNDSVAVYVVYGATPAAIDSKPDVIEFSNAYPNPASTSVSFNYDLQGNSGVASLVITDLLGGEVFSTVLLNDKGKLNVDVSTLTPGVYFYSLRINQKSQFTRKLVVK